MSKYRILSFDGGGIRGTLTVTLLKRLSEAYPQLISNTNLFAGTSTGSIIALGLASGLSIEEVAKLYSFDSGQYIFSRKSLGLMRPKYTNQRLRDVLLGVFPQNLRLMDLQKHVVIPAFKINGSKTKNWRPVFFNNFPDSNTKRATVVDVVLASSAAPIYFPSYQKHLDGGLIANNPCTAAISIASDPYYANKVYDEICLLSIGTGFNPHKITRDTTKWGLLQWVFSTNPTLPLETIMLEGAVEADSYFCYQFLKDNFYRLNPELSKTIPLDDYQQIPYLKTLANTYNLSQTLAWVKDYWLEDNLTAASDKKKDFNEFRAKYWHNLHNKN